LRHLRTGLLLLMALIAFPARAAVAQETPRPAAGVHYVYLIRHGMYDRDRDVDEVVGNGLNALGHEQARLIGARLAALPVRPASLIGSTYRRARETAEDIGAILKMTPLSDSLIHECGPASDRQDGDAEEALCDSNLVAAWAKYMTPSPEADRHDVLVCHGNVIRWFVSRAVHGDPRRWPWMEAANGSLTILSVRPDGTFRLVCFNDVGHLPLAKQTWSGKGAGWGAAKP